MQIKIRQNVLQANEIKANEIRQLLAAKGVFMLNIISSPGSGKTTLLEKTIPYLKKKYKIVVIEGDVESHRDAERLDSFGVPVASVNTGGSCHIESVSIEKALESFNLDDLDLIIVENVGNMVCPAEFDLGENVKVAMISTPEGADKAGKYPLLFREASVVLLNKIDLLPYLDFKKEVFYQDMGNLNAQIPVIEISCQIGQGLENWFDWLEKKLKKKVRYKKRK
jgi:hydrogenase nickel incorporation protein HypB